MRDELERDYAALTQHLASSIHEEVKVNGFYDDPIQNKAEKIALMHSELSEALEGLRHGDPASDKIPNFTATEEELADCIIRILDYAGWQNLRLGAAIVAKLAYNRGRPYKHGKKF